MTLTRFVTKNAFRNKRRSVLTILSIGFSLLLLTFMMTIWRSFYIDEVSAQAAQRLIVRHKVSLVFNLPGFYREKIRVILGVTHVVNEQWCGGLYKDDKLENFFAQFGTDPQELLSVYPEARIPAEQVEAWQHDRAGAIVDSELVKKYKWKIGDRLNIKGTIFPLNLELTIRGIFTAPTPTQTIYFTKTSLAAFVLVGGMARQGGFLTGMRVTPPTMLVALLVAALVGFVSAFLPSYHASRVNIVDGLRHIG